jgi:4-hydroxybenzoate polyprenyltransferase
LLALLGRTTAVVTLGLVLCIVAYDLVHKRTALAPLLMAGCRFLLYLVVGSAALGGINAKLLWCAGALAAYIVGLSFIARKEADGGRPQPQRVDEAASLTNKQRRLASEGAAAGDSCGQQLMGLNLLVLPLFITPLITGHLRVTPENNVTLGLVGVGYVSWVIWSLWHMIKGGAPGAIGRTVSALLAGIVLVDMLAVQGGGGWMPLAFLALSAGALILQRTIPAT